jgi:hypothetical protein
MSPLNDTDLPPQNSGSDHVQDLLAHAHSRLLLVPGRSDGSKVVVVTTVGAFDLRLVELTRTVHGIPPLWIELYDSHSNRIVDSVGRRDLQDLVAITIRLIAQARRLSFTLPFRGSR